jgi:hypothetical protein
LILLLDWRLKGGSPVDIFETIFMTIVIKIRNDLERSGDVLAARKKRGILLVKNLAIVWRSTKSKIDFK